ncbi:MAG: hypothetical protein OXC26_25320 [Albidovulum sp.]|nr:hypothetical protein [Albidovulum sp.]
MFASFTVLARYNAWANRRMHKTCARMTIRGLMEDRSAFWSSIYLTLEHIYAADRLYRDRLEKQPISLEWPIEQLFDGIDELSKAQFDLDNWYIEFNKTLTQEQLQADWPFESLDDDPVFINETLGTCLSNLYQHQVHHRGQVHNMLSQAGVYPPPMDYVLFAIEDRGDEIPHDIRSRWRE